MKYYALKNTKKIYNNWTDCQQAIKDVYKPQFKSFTTYQEALDFVNDVESTNIDFNDYLSRGYYCAYIDGSYNEDTKCYGSGIVLFKSKEEMLEYSFLGNDENYIESRNVSGEVFALTHLLEILKLNNQTRAVIYYDYIGLENWYNNKWQTKSNIALYLLSVKRNYTNLELIFKKVLAHSNDKYNDMADKLAKKAVGI